MNSKVCKSCAVPQCDKTSKLTPSKLLIYVSHTKTMRYTRKWLDHARRDPAAIGLNSTIYFCEDHFDVYKDCTYMEVLILRNSAEQVFVQCKKLTQHQQINPLGKLQLVALVLVLLFLNCIPWPGPSVFKITCSRDNSKIVRKVIQNKWLPVLERFQVKLPLECPFHPARDIFAPQHAAKLQHRSSQWTCAFCGKSFYEERHLDTHFDQRHKNQINKAEDAVCLADYCDIMRCQVLVAHGLMNGGSGPSTDIELWQDAEAAKKALAPASSRSIARVPTKRRQRSRTQPPAPVADCPKTDSGSENHETDDQKREESESDVNQTAELCDADTVESSLPPDSRQRRLADLQAERAACDPARLQGIKVRCERVVHSCIATLLLHLTQHQFTELEDEMQRAVCWYLSCDRYWEDTAPAARAFPWPLLLALATGLALALCMCYYIIWIVFDSEEGSVAGSGSVSMTTQSSPARGERLAGDDALDDDHDDHYIYVTYPPDLKRRLLESCYNRTTRL